MPALQGVPRSSDFNKRTWYTLYTIQSKVIQQNRKMWHGVKFDILSSDFVDYSFSWAGWAGLNILSKLGFCWLFSFFQMGRLGGEESRTFTSSQQQQQVDLRRDKRSLNLDISDVTFLIFSCICIWRITRRFKKWHPIAKGRYKKGRTKTSQKCETVLTSQSIKL